MMDCHELTILIPCHSLEDFPLYHSGEDATALLAAWSVLWHPLLINHVGKVPTWARCDDPPEDFANRLMILPTTHGCDLPSGYAQRVKTGGGKLIRKLTSREELATAALSALEITPPENWDEQVTQEFYALGMSFLWTELLTRRMRYMSLLDEVRFQNAVVTAAQAIALGDRNTYQSELQVAQDQLLQARNHFYPVDCFFLELILVVPNVAGAALRNELQRQQPVTLLLNGETLRHIATNEPETMALIRERLANGNLSLIGGGERDTEYPFQTAEQILTDLRSGWQTWQDLLQRAPSGFARRRAGLASILPQILKQFDYQSALHVTLDEGQFPTSARTQTNWQAWGAQSIPCIAQVPLEAHNPGTLLNLPEKLGDTMDHDHVAQLIWAHWPGQASPFFHDLQRAHTTTPILGKFITWDELFEHAANASETHDWNTDDYRTPYLLQDVIRRTPQPISRLSPVTEYQESASQTLTALSNYVQPGANSIATVLKVKPDTQGNGILLTNPTSVSQRRYLEWPADQYLPVVTGPVLAATSTEQRSEVLAEIPAFGFAVIVAGETAPAPAPPVKQGWSLFAKQPAPPPLIAQDMQLSNEFCIVKISPQTGTILSIFDQRVRGNRISQQLGIRLGDGPETTHWDELPDYTTMQADQIAITRNSTLCGEITSTGRLLNPAGETLAQFQQRTRLYALCNRVEVDLELTTEYAYRAEPWKSYAAIRWAWGEELIEVYRSIQQTCQRTDAKRIEAPDYIEIRDGKRTTALLLPGLCYHQRVGNRRLDTLLQVKGETTNQFQFAIQLDPANTSQSALQKGVSPIPERISSSAKSSSAGWFLHIDVKGVIATSISCITEPETKQTGLRVRLLETTGHAGPVKLRGIRPWKSARKVNFLGTQLEVAELVGDAALFYLAANEWCEIELY